MASRTSCLVLRFVAFPRRSFRAVAILFFTTAFTIQFLWAQMGATHIQGISAAWLPITTITRLKYEEKHKKSDGDAHKNKSILCSSLVSYDVQRYELHASMRAAD